MENIQEQINQKNADILTAKAFLWDTDYQVIKSYERGIVLDADIKKLREDARDLIDTRQAEIEALQLELDNQEINNTDPIPY